LSGGAAGGTLEAIKTINIIDQLFPVSKRRLRADYANSLDYAVHQQRIEEQDRSISMTV
jgi:hypothetical protein